MKNLDTKIDSRLSRLLLSLTFILILTNSYSQYFVSVDQKDYEPLNGTVLAYIPSEGGYYANGDFQFAAFGTRTANFIQNASIPSNGAFIATVGLVAVYESPDYLNTIVFQPFETSAITAVEGVSSVLAGWNGDDTTNILSFEFRDFVYQNDVNQLVNFRLNINEHDSTFSVHFGENSLLSRAVPGYCGVQVFNQSFTAIVDQSHAYGSPSDPMVSDSATSSNDILPLDSLPEEGTIITFSLREKKEITDPVEPEGQAEIEQNLLTISPNPAQDFIYIKGLSKSSEVEIRSMTGTKIMTSRVSNQNPVVDVQSLAPGCYVLALRGSRTEHYKFIRH